MKRTLTKIRASRPGGKSYVERLRDGDLWHESRLLLGEELAADTRGQKSKSGCTYRAHTMVTSENQH